MIEDWYGGFSFKLKTRVMAQVFNIVFIENWYETFANAFVKFHYLDAEGFSTSERRAMSLMYASNFIAHPDTSSMSTFAEARVSFLSEL